MKRFERLNSILELVSDRGFVDIDTLAELTGASLATIRRDLDHLDSDRLIRRMRGGAAPVESVSYEVPLRIKSERRTVQKQRIGERAATLVTSGMVVGINGGTTALEVARAFSAAAGGLSPVGGPALTVVTNAMTIAYELSVRPQIKLLLTGGVTRPSTFELVGPFSEDMVASLTLDLAFIGADGVDADFGISARDEQEAKINGIFARQAEKVAVIVDSTKLSRKGFVRICRAAEVDMVITDEEADEAAVEALARVGVEVLFS